MNFTRWTAVAILAAMLNLHAQTPTPIPTQSSAPVSGPTMEQTIGFINDAFAQHGHFQVDYDPDWLIIFNKVLWQKLSQTAPCELLYESSDGIQVRKREDWTPEAPVSFTDSQKIRLNEVDPRALSVVQANPKAPATLRESTVRLAVEDNHDYLVGGRPSDRQKNRMDLGVFVNQDIAESVAKAYIHAIVLCHKPEAPSLF